MESICRADLPGSVHASPLHVYGSLDGFLRHFLEADVGDAIQGAALSEGTLYAPGSTCTHPA